MDAILNPDKTDPYKHLKISVISCCGESTTQEIGCTLAGEKLGDRKPSKLLWIMQQCAELHNVSDDLVLELFL